MVYTFFKTIKEIFKIKENRLTKYHFIFYGIITPESVSTCIHILCICNRCISDRSRIQELFSLLISVVGLFFQLCCKKENMLLSSLPPKNSMYFFPQVIFYRNGLNPEKCVHLYVYIRLWLMFLLERLYNTIYSSNKIRNTFYNKFHIAMDSHRTISLLFLFFAEFLFS